MTTPAENSLLLAALDYAKRNIPVFPLHNPISSNDGLTCSCADPKCESKAKHPRTAHGFKDATVDQTIIKEWWSRWPRANIGIPTGAASGFDVVDIDNEQAQQKLKELISDTSLAAVQKTGRGWQLAFAHVESGLTIASALGGIDGLDFRGNCGYIVAAPSQHITGKFYTWVRPLTDSLPMLPDAFIKFASAPINKEAGFKEPFNSAIVWEGVPDGKRDETLFKFACQLRALNAPEDVARKLVAEAAARCKPPFENAQAKVDQAYKYPAGKNGTEGGKEFVSSPKEGIGKETNWHPLSVAEILTLSTPEILWVWQGLIPIGSLFLLCAYMKVGKSTLAYRIALAIAQGLACLDRATTKTGVLILAVEEHIRDIRRRLERFGMTPEMEIYVILDRGQARDLDKIREFVMAKNIGLVLIDSLSRWWDVTDENNNMEVLRAVSPLLDLAHDDSVGVAIGLIVHERKSGGEDGRGIRGGSSLFGLVDQAIILDRRPGETSNKRLLKTLGRYEDSPKEIIIELVGNDYSVLGTPDQEGHAQAVGKVRDALTAEPMDVKTLAVETGLTQKMVRRALESMGDEIKESGSGVRNDPHTYSLLSQYSPIGKETNVGREIDDQNGWVKAR